MNLMNNSYLEINLRTLRNNIQHIFSTLPPNCSVIPVLKDDAYGLGICRIASVLEEYDKIHCIAVSHVSEGLTLRAAGIKKDILIMSCALPFQLEAAILSQLTLTIPSLRDAVLIHQSAQSLGMHAKVQIKLDIGLHRIGIDPHDELACFLAGIKDLDSIDYCGVFSHFSHVGDDALCKEQFSLFQEGIANLKKAGINCAPSHISCSASSELYPDYMLDAVRLGRRLYMDSPDFPTGGIREIASWRSYVCAVKPRKAGERIGYNGQHTLQHDAVVATLGVGYGDGLNEKLCDVPGVVLIQGKPCNLLACCMDQCLVDVTGIDCKPGDEVTFFGYDSEGNFLSSQEIAARIHANEGCALTSALSARVARIYVD